MGGFSFLFISSDKLNFYRSLLCCCRLPGIPYIGSRSKMRNVSVYKVQLSRWWRCGDWLRCRASIGRVSPVLSCSSCWCHSVQQRTVVWVSCHVMVAGYTLYLSIAAVNVFCTLLTILFSSQYLFNNSHPTGSCWTCLCVQVNQGTTVWIVWIVQVEVRRAARGGAAQPGRGPWEQTWCPPWSTAWITCGTPNSSRGWHSLWKSARYL